MRDDDRKELEAVNHVVREKSGELECERAGIGGLRVALKGIHTDLKSNHKNW